MAYPPVIAAALSGATLRQLSYWRSNRSAENPLLAPAFHKPRSRVSYSFPDVVALRTFVYLRSRDVPLQRARGAVDSLRKVGIIWKVSAEVAVDLTGESGQHNIVNMIDILGAFHGSDNRVVTPLLSPEPGVSVDPDVRGGYPVIRSKGREFPMTWWPASCATG
jgi:hypothetical protein